MLYDEGHLYAATKLTKNGVPFPVAVRIMQRTVWGVTSCEDCRLWIYDHDICCMPDCHTCRTCALSSKIELPKSVVDEKLGLFICKKHGAEFCKHDICTNHTSVDRCVDHPLKCNECDKRFPSKSHLVKHMRSTGPCARAIRDREARRNAEVPKPYNVTYDCTTCKREISACVCYYNRRN